MGIEYEGKNSGKRLVVWKELGQDCINGSGWGETKFEGINDIFYNNKKVDW